MASRFVPPIVVPTTLATLIAKSVLYRALLLALNITPAGALAQTSRRNATNGNHAWRHQRAYFSRLPSIAAQACATAEFAGSAPGIVAQPPFSMKEPCCQELTFLNSTRFEATSALC